MRVSERQPVADPRGAARSDRVPWHRCQHCESLGAPLGPAQLPPVDQRRAADFVALERLFGCDRADDAI